MQRYAHVKQATTKQGDIIENRVFRLIAEAKRNDMGMFIVVDGTEHDDLRNGNVRLYISGVDQYEPIDKSTAERVNRTSEAETVNTSTDAELAAELRDTFNILEEMTKAVACNVVKGLVVSGPAGVGKSYTVENTLTRNLSMLQLLRSGQAQYEVISGGMSAPVLFEKLYEYREEGQVLVFDDCDSILYDEDSLNILKAALDSKKVRRISWNTRSLHLEKRDIPNTFEYKGGIIFITNVDFNHVKSPRISNHLEAIVSRCHYMTLGMNTTREKIVRIKDVIATHDMLADYNFENNEGQEVLDYIANNATRLREISLRTVLKVADLRKAMPANWVKFADRNVLRSV